MTEERQIDYDALLHEAFRDAQRSVMRSILTRVAEQGLPGEHHFYISFNTLAPGVSIAPRLLQKYPAEMTIVLQHRFWDLFVQADRFEVKLTFDGIRERLQIPFAAVRMFFDPSVPYGLQFEESSEGRPSNRGEMIGLAASRGGGRGGKASADRTQSERSLAERGQTERKKASRKKSESTADAPSDASGVLAGPESGDVKTKLPVPVDISEATPKSRPRLVETANDSAKVVSLDQFRKK